MPQASRPIVLTTRTFGSHSGVSQVAPDVLLALCRCSCQLRVRTWVPGRPPTHVDGHAIGPYRLEGLPLGAVARAIASGDAPPRSLFEHARLLLTSPRQPTASNTDGALEVVNGLGAHALYRCALAAGRAGGPGARTALIVHESPRHFDAQGSAGLSSAIEAVRGYQHHVFVSDRGRSEWTALARLDPARGCYIPNCVREQRVEQVRLRERAQLRRDFGYHDESLCVVSVGSVSARKGQDLVLEALRVLGTTQPAVRVEFLGPCDTPWAKQLRASVRGTALAARVRFLGSVHDAYERTYAADALLLASRAEAFPMSVLEALALGTCVVASDVDGVGEQVVHEQSGLLFAGQDVTAMAAHLGRLTREPQLRAALAAGGRERYLRHFTRAQQLARWSDAVRMMLG
jgi:glycosyltransferase involved in cell wall biosynthesis